MDLKVSVDYYNSAEKKLFESSPSFPDLKEMNMEDFTIPKDEFISYMMFTEQANEEGWRSYKELHDRVSYRLGDIEDILDFSKGSIQSKLSSIRMNSSKMTERIGVSLGINVINKLHGLTEADWAITDDTYIDGKRVKDFDYELPLASDGTKFIQVENKGTISDDNSSKSPSISAHYKSIKEKKTSIKAREKVQNTSDNIYYGTIGVLDNMNKAKVWLVDPPAFQGKWDPKKFKLLSRLIYYSRVFEEINIHKQFRVALTNRIKEISREREIENLNNKALKISPNIQNRYIQGNNFAKINNTEAFGSFFFINSSDNSNVFLIALTKKIIQLILLQKFDDILEYDYRSAELSDSVSIELSANLKSTSKTNLENNFVFDEKRKRYFYQSYQKISSISSGRIFGVVNTK